MRKDSRVIETDGHRDEVIDMVVRSVPYTEIARKFGYAPETVSIYVRDCLLKGVAMGASRSRRKLTDDFMSSLSYQQDKCERLIEACHEWLRKPGRSGKYTLDPRADEITVVYRATEEDMATGKLKEVKKEATLQELLDGREEVVSLKWKYQDPRRLILDALSEARQQTELIARVTGELKEIAEATDVYAIVAMVIDAITSEEGISAKSRRQLIDSIEAGMALMEQGIMAG